jgi:hypothetical protein
MKKTELTEVKLKGNQKMLLQLVSYLIASALNTSKYLGKYNRYVDVKITCNELGEVKVHLKNYQTFGQVTIV